MTGPTLVTVPCFSGAPWRLEELTPLAGRPLRTMRLPENVDDIEAYADFVEAQVAELDDYVLVGDSFGAVVSLAVALRHPALGAVLTARGMTTPSVFHHLETGLSLLRSAGFEPRTAVEVYYALFTYTLGFLAWEIPRVHRQPPADYARQWADSLASLPAGDYPTLHELADELPTATSDSQFEAGIVAMLTGFSASRKQKARPKPGPGKG